MNIASKKFCLVIAGAALLLAGCTKKPKRTDPSATVIGPTPGGTVIPTDLNPLIDPNASALQVRDPNIFEDEFIIKGMFQPVFFDYDSSNIKAGERTKLQDAQKYLKDHPEQRLLFEGHCDWRGTAEYNLSLGDRRAAAAQKYFTSIGVSSEKSEIRSKGSLEAAKNADESTMAKDRRVDIIILKK